MTKERREKSSVRDFWVAESWRYNGAGVHRSRKKELPRKAKHKGLDY